MKYTLFFLLLMFSATLAKAQNHLTVKVNGMTSNEGYILVDVVDSTNTSVERSRTKAQTNEVSIILDELPNGVYMVHILQDMDNNYEMTSNMIGLPKEPYGFSKDVMGMFGPPDFEDASFEFKSDTTIVINLKGL